MFKARPYQQEIIDVVISGIQKNIKSQLITAPTGAGKTVIATKIIKRLTNDKFRVFFVVAGSELVLQSYEKFKGSGISCSVIKAGLDKYYNENADCQVVMIQSYARRSKNMPDLNADIIIVDEVDFGFNGGMLKGLMKKYPDAYIIGLTATPITDKGYLLPDFDFYYDKVTVRDLQNQGFLSVDKNYIPATPDLTDVHVANAGDFKEDELEKACSKSYIIDDVIKTYKEKDKGYKGICFAISIKHAESLQKAFTEAGVHCGIVHSKAKKFLNQYWLDAHKAGRIRVLINVGMLTRGYDDVDIIDILICRPTMSERLYKQMVGRGARLDTVGRKYFRHFDYAGNIERFGLWSEPRLYSLDDTPKKEHTFDPVVCPGCFCVIYEKSSTCPECGWSLIQKQEAREREIEASMRANQLVEIVSSTGSQGAIDALNTVMMNGNTFYYTKLYGLKPLDVSDDIFNSEVKRIAKHANKNNYKPMYIYYKVRDKFSNRAILQNV